MRHLLLLPVLLLTLLVGNPAFSADFQKGLDAVQKGDFATALKEWKPLAEKGHAKSQYHLGVMYYEGEGVPQNVKTAVKWFRLAAEQGYANAQNNLGWMYRKGNGVPQNYETALKWLILSAEQGYARAQSNLGWMYRKGNGVPQDYKTAVKWYRLAAEQGFARAQSNLGWMYEKGKSVPQNYETALKWFILSADKGYKKAKINRDKIETLMTSAQIAKAQELARNFVPQKTLPVIIAQKITPTVTAKKSPEPSSEVQNENKRLRKEEAKAKAQRVAEAERKAEEERKAKEEAQRVAEAKRKAEVERKKKEEQQRIRKLAKEKTKELAKLKEQALAKQEEDAKKRQTQKKEKSPEPSSQVKKELDELRKKIARLEKEKKQKPQPTPKTATSGSGFFVSKKGHVITNQHIVNKCKEVTVGDNAQKQVTADVLETDRSNDLALLRISSSKMASADTKSLISKLGITVVPLASHGLLRSEDVELGERVLVAGYPYGDIFSNTIKVTGGMVSANRGLGDDTGQFQMDAAVQPGNSGGPIYDENGNIVGVVVAQLNKRKFEKMVGSMPENVNFGIKASTVRQFLTSSGLPTKWSKRSKSMSTRELAKIAKNQTVMVVCHP